MTPVPDSPSLEEGPKPQAPQLRVDRTHDAKIPLQRLSSVMTTPLGQVIDFINLNLIHFWRSRHLPRKYVLIEEFCIGLNYFFFIFTFFLDAQLTKSLEASPRKIPS